MEQGYGLKRTEVNHCMTLGSFFAYNLAQQTFMYVHKDLYCCFAYVGSINKQTWIQCLERKIKACVANVLFFGGENVKQSGNEDDNNLSFDC